jgi:hypothetical protein
VIREQIGKNLHQIINTIYLIPIFYEDSPLNPPSLGDFEREHLKFVRTDELADRGENQRK